MQRILLGIAALALVGLAGAGAFLWLHQPQGLVSPAQINIAGSDIGGPFTLTDQDGRRVSSADLIKGPTLIYFGYTFCPDVCPVDVAVMASATEMLARKGIEVTPVFITIDPERDTPAAMKAYVRAMSPTMIGLTGSAADIKAAAGAYKVFYARKEAESASEGAYGMNHSTFTYLVTPKGVLAAFRRGYKPEEIASAVAKILSRAAGGGRTTRAG
jgi:protein SCO1/2